MAEKTKRLNKTIEKADIIYNFLREYTLKYGYPPTVREIVDNPKCGIKSTASAKQYLDLLAEDGKIIKSASKFRAIEVVDVKKPVPDKPLADDSLSSVNATRIPLLGNIAAGQPLYAAVEDSQSYTLPNDYFEIKNEMFLLQVKGHSMEKIGIMDGDIVLIKSQPTANNGQIVVAQIDGNEVTLKRFYNCGSYIKLKPENDDYDDIIVTPDQSFRILGIAKGLMRNHIV
ncbi:MAG: transcriptional repressor LexA [Clostridiales bacterium]|nr:transcriptional repressor LexA [Clostridiales bacterium]